MTDRVLTEMELMIRCDPAGRGLISSENRRGRLCFGHLGYAAKHLAAKGRRVLLVTGFYIPGASPPAAETDGPLGAVLLAKVLIEAGVSCQLVTDRACESAVTSVSDWMGLPANSVLTIPTSCQEQDEWCERLLSGDGGSQFPAVSHLISIERVGPSHTINSIRQQLELLNSASWIKSTDLDSTGNPATTNQTVTPIDIRHEQYLAEFEQEVPEDHRDRCHNMRGECIDAHSAPLHRLFELAGNRPDIRTIGIGDGGNEIGMGSIPWWELKSRLSGPQAGWVPCRIATDWTIVAGVSNWGGQALAAAVLFLSGKTEVARAWTKNQKLECLGHLVREGPAVDGVTRRPEPTVDGLPFETYIHPWMEIRRLIGLDDDA